MAGGHIFSIPASEESIILINLETKKYLSALFIFVILPFGLMHYYYGKNHLNKFIFKELRKQEIV